MEEYKDEVRQPGSQSWAVPQRAGSAYALGSCGGDGWPFRQGGQPGAAPVEWGAEEDADYSKVTGWVVVTDLAGKSGDEAVLEGHLLAAYWGGKIWLKLQAGKGAGEGAGDSAGESGEPEEEDAPDGSACLGCCGEDGWIQSAPRRPVYPSFYICPMDEREEYLKTAEGQWRADVDWEVLANYNYVETKSWILYDSKADKVIFASDRMTTIWIIPVGNIICFYTTSFERYAGNEWDSPLNTPSQFMLYSAFGRPYAGDGADAGPMEVGPFYPYRCAPLPWEEEGAAPFTLPDGETLCAAGGTLGTEGLAGRAMEDGLAAGIPPSMAPGLYICPRYHTSNYLGIWWPLAGNVVLAFEPFSAADATGYGTWLDACGHYIIDDINTSWWFENGQDYLFDPWAVEAQGLCPGYDNAGHFTKGGTDWPQATISDSYKKLASLSLPVGSSGHTLHLVIAGAETPDALLTSSLFATEMGNRDMDDGLSEDSNVKDPSGGGYGGAGSDQEDDDDSSPLDGYYYEAGSGGVRISSKRQVSADDVTYTFTISVSGTSSASQGLSWEVQAKLTTKNGGSYTYNGQNVDMYYGFGSSTAGTSVTLNYKASFLYGDDDPKECTCTLTLTSSASLTASFPGTATLTSDDAPPGSSLFSFTPSGKSRYVMLRNGQRKKFAIYSISLSTTTLQQLMRGKAIAQAPTSATITPGSVSGSGGNTSAPTVNGSISKTTLRTQGSSINSEGFLAPAIQAVYNQASGSISVSGGGSWHYDEGVDEEGNPVAAATSGSISGSFTIKIPRTTKTL